MFLLNSRSHLFTAAHFHGHTFSRSYGIILPSSFSRVLSSALEFSSHPPVSVYGTANRNLMLRGFSWKQGIHHFMPSEDGIRHHASGLRARICLSPLPNRLNRDVQHPAGVAFSVTPSQSREVLEY